MTALVLAAALTAPVPPEAAGRTLAALEAKLHGEWRGGACQGDWTFRADGTYEVRSYTPGQNHLTGTWAVRWDAVPPTLALTVRGTDAPARFPLGQKSEWKLVELSGDAFAYLFPGHTEPIRYERAKKAAEPR